MLITRKEELFLIWEMCPMRSMLMTMHLSWSPNFGDAHFQKGFALLEVSRFENAIAEFDRALEIDPDPAPAHYNRGVALAKLLRFNDAIVSFDKTLSLLPGYAPAFFQKGLALYAIGITRIQ